MITFPYQLQSRANERHHWRAKARITKCERALGKMMCPRPIPLPLVVTLTRVGPALLDDDNLPAAFKAIRDGVADRLMIRDNDPRVTWRYAQEKGDRKTKTRPAQYEIRIALDPR